MSDSDGIRSNAVSSAVISRPSRQLIKTTASFGPRYSRTRSSVCVTNDPLDPLDLRAWAIVDRLVLEASSSPTRTSAVGVPAASLFVGQGLSAPERFTVEPAVGLLIGPAPSAGSFQLSAISCQPEQSATST